MSLLERLDELNVGTPNGQEYQPLSPISSHPVIEQVFTELDDNIGAWYTDDFLAALAGIERTDRQQFARIYARLKKWGIATEVKRAVRVFSRKQRISKNPTLPTHSTKSSHSASSIQHFTRIEPTLAPGILITVNEESGQPSLVIESEGAMMLAEAIRGFVAYAQGAKTWHLFDGARWEPMSGTERIDELFIELLYQGTAGVGFKKAYKNNVRDIVADGNFLPLPPSDQQLIPFQNGLLHCQSQQLQPITPVNALTWCLPYHYHPQADCPRIQTWLLSAVDNDDETLQLLRAWLAALLHGRADLQKFLHLIGSGGTGKGTFMRLATALVGRHNAVSTTLKEMENNRFETARYYGARLVQITDSDKYGGSLDTLKALTGQDPVRLERKHQQQSGDFVFGGLVIMASNENLMSTDHSSGLERRRITVIFDRRATDEEKQVWQALGGEETVLHSELPGLVNWLLELSPEQIGQILRNPPQRIRAANLEAMKAGNPVAEWLTDCCISDPNEWTQIGDKREIRDPGTETRFEHADSRLYPNYLTWCQRHSRSPHSIRRFREVLIDTLKALKIDAMEVRKSTGQGVKGIRLRREWESADARYSR